jgi:hypothetical protein
VDRPQTAGNRNSRISEPWLARQQRHLAAIAEFTSDLRYLPGPQNVVVDALSRPPDPTAAAADHAAAAATTMEDPIDFPAAHRRRRRTANAGGSASTSPPNQRPQILEPFFLHSLAGFLNAQRRRPRAATPADNAGSPPPSRTTASFSLTATKKLEGPMW